MNATTSSLLLSSRASNNSTVLDLFIRTAVFVRGNHADFHSGGLLGDGYLWRGDSGTTGKTAKFNPLRNEMVSDRQGLAHGG